TVIAAGDGTLSYWSLRKQTQSGLTVNTESIECGAAYPDACSPIFSQAFAQYTPDNIWDLSTMQKSSFSMTFPSSPDPGEAYLTPNEVSLQGLTLANRSG